MRRVQRILYNGMLIEDWLLNQHDPARHNDTLTLWQQEQDAKRKRKAK